MQVGGTVALHAVAPPTGTGAVHGAQTPPQVIVPAGHAWHRPPAQLAPVGHGVPHAPQLFGSVWVFTHAFPQRFGSAEVLHAATHMFPVPQANAPLVGAGLVVGHAAHVPGAGPQFKLLPGHGWQVPPMQAAPVAHGLAQVPQLFGSV